MRQRILRAQFHCLEMFRMKPACCCVRLLLAAALLVSALVVSAQQSWRPFRPESVYTFRTANADSVFTLRVDSVYANGLDSVYRFNRTLRVTRQGNFYPTTNNVFGARMQFRPGTSSYTFYLDADVLGGARQWTFVAGTAEGAAYSQASTPASTATVLSKRPRTVAVGVIDSVMTLRTLPDNDTLAFSRRYGALQMPRCLYRGQRGSKTLYQANLPLPIGQLAYYSPRVLFNYQPGDEFGLRTQDPYAAVSCYLTNTLRRILTRQETADSLVFTYLEQTRNQLYGYGPPWCGLTSSVTLTPITVRRLAVSLRTGRSQQYPYLGLLTLEYARVPFGTTSQVIQAALPLTNRGSGGCGGSGRFSSSLRLYQVGSGAAAYRPGLDAAGWFQYFGLNVGEIQTYYTQLAYYTRHPLTGPMVSCGVRTDFATLLPTRAEQMAVLATLHPNPAIDAATLTLAAPARPGHILRLTDALGRFVWSAPMPTGQTTVVVPLAGRPAGLYLLHLNGPDTTPVAWKLTHEQ